MAKHNCPRHPTQGREERAPYADIETAYQHFKDDLLSYARGRLLDPNDAQDVAHDAFVRAILAAQHGHGCAFPKSYFYKAVDTAIIDWMRKRSRASAKMLAWHQIQDSHSPPINETAVIIRCAVARLPVRCRDAIMLVRFQGLSYKQAASLMGVSPRTVEAHIRRAIGLLRLGAIREDVEAIISSAISDDSP